MERLELLLHLVEIGLDLGLQECLAHIQTLALFLQFRKCVNCSHEIEPMLLIPFVENAFKHGTGIIECAQINIDLKETNGMLQFIVSNKYNDNLNAAKDKSSGIGLNNVQRRLNLLYGNNHTLLINKENGWFTVSLQINLH